MQGVRWGVHEPANFLGCLLSCPASLASGPLSRFRHLGSVPWAGPVASCLCRLRSPGPSLVLVLGLDVSGIRALVRLPSRHGPDQCVAPKCGHHHRRGVGGGVLPSSLGSPALRADLKVALTARQEEEMPPEG